MNALTKAARRNIDRENYIIAIVCGIALGIMFGVAV